MIRTWPRNSDLFSYNDWQIAMTQGWQCSSSENDFHFGDAFLREWFESEFPNGPTQVQQQSWPIIASGQNALIIASTGSGKTLAGFLSLIDRLLVQQKTAEQSTGVSYIYISPLKSLGYDVEKNLNRPLHAISKAIKAKAGDRSLIRVGVRTGDTSTYQRQKLRNNPPNILVTTPESLSILLTQKSWAQSFAGLKAVIIDEIHSLAGTKRGSDLALSLERLAAIADTDPQRIGLSATCRPAQTIASYLVGPHRTCTICQIDGDHLNSPETMELRVESLIKPDEAAYRPLVQHRLIGRLNDFLADHKTTVVFTNTRPMTERITFLMREHLRNNAVDDSIVAAHHGSLDQAVRQQVEASLKSGALRMVVSTTSLELGVDYDSADFVAQFGLPASVSRCLQRLGRSGHGPGRRRRGVILAGHASELAVAVVTAQAALRGDIEEIRIIENPLDVLCQQILAMACLDDPEADEAYKRVCSSWPFRNLQRRDFDACLNYLAGELPSPAGAYEPEQGAAPRWSAPRIWKSKGQFGVRHGRIVRWFRMNVGTIYSEESIAVECDSRRIGRIESAYADRLQAGDRFVLDGKPLEYRKTESNVIVARKVSGEALLPIWTSERPGLSADLSTKLATFRDVLARQLVTDPDAARNWLIHNYAMRSPDADMLLTLWQRQLHVSEVPRETEVLVEIYPETTGWSYAFHLPLHRAASETLGRGISARMGKHLGRDIQLSVSDMGFLIQTNCEPLDKRLLESMFHVKNLEADVIEGLDKGELIARRFRHSAATGFMVLKNTETGKVKVGGQDWVSRRLFPVVRECCPDHPLIREARREALEEILDLPSAEAFLQTNPMIRVRTLRSVSPFTAAWLEPFGVEATEPIQYESPEDALKRLHDRLFAKPGGATLS